MPRTLSLMATKSPKLHMGSVCRARRYASATGERDAPSNPLYELACAGRAWMCVDKICVCALDSERAPPLDSMCRGPTAPRLRRRVWACRRLPSCVATRAQPPPKGASNAAISVGESWSAPMAAPAGDTCLKEAAAGRPSATRSSCECERCMCVCSQLFGAALAGARWRAQVGWVRRRPDQSALRRATRGASAARFAPQRSERKR